MDIPKHFEFDDLEFKPHPILGSPHIQAMHVFPNGYGVSVVRGPATRGGTQGLYELAVMRNGEVCYTTPVTQDTIGYLKPRDINKLLAQVAAL